MTTASNKALVRRHYEEVINQQKIPLIDELYTPSIHLWEGPNIEREGFKDFARMSVSAFPDLKVTVEDQIAEGDKVVTRVTGRGTHRDVFAGIPATGKSVTLKVIHIHRIVDGRIAALWELIDMYGLQQQLAT